MSDKNLPDNLLRILVTELLAEKGTFSIEDAIKRFGERFPTVTKRINESEGHDLHDTLGGRLHDYSGWSGSRRMKYNPPAPKIERADEGRTYRACD